MKKIAVVGANGRTGARAVEQALARGHHVTALARRPESVGPRHASLNVVAADVLRPETLAGVLGGADAVISALGIGTSREPTTLYSEGVGTLLAAMRADGVAGPLAVISAAPVGPRDEATVVERRVMMPLLERFFGATYADMRRMEEILRGGDTDWISLRPPRLLDRPATGHYRLGTDGPLPRARRITHADLATALLDVLDRPDLYRRGLPVSQ